MITAAGAPELVARAAALRPLLLEQAAETEQRAYYSEEIHRAFLDAVKSGQPGPVRSSFADAVRTLEVALAANESAQTGKLISL